MSRASPLQVASLFLLGLLLVPQSAFGQNPNKPVENKDYFVSESGDETIKDIRIAHGVNLNTEAFAKRFGVTPFDIRRENPTTTLALCKKNGRFHMSPGIISPETRKIETIWSGCDEKNRYTYIVPGSTLHINVRKHHPTFEQERQAVEILKACSAVATTSCILPALELLGLSLETPEANKPVPTVIPQPVVKEPTAPVKEPSPKIVTVEVEKTPAAVLFLVVVLVIFLVVLNVLSLHRGTQLVWQRKVQVDTQEKSDADYAELKKDSEDRIRHLKQAMRDAAIEQEDQTNKLQRDYNAELRVSTEALKSQRAEYEAELKRQREQFETERASAIQAALNDPANRESIFTDQRKEIVGRHARVEQLESQNAQLIVELSSVQDSLRELQTSVTHEREAFQQSKVECARLYHRSNELLEDQKHLQEELGRLEVSCTQLDQQVADVDTDLSQLAPLQTGLIAAMAQVTEVQRQLADNRLESSLIQDDFRRELTQFVGVSCLPPPV